MLYSLIKQLHILTVVLTALAFSWRLRERLAGHAITGRFWAVAPHVNDSILLACGIALVVMSGQYPFVQGWLTAKMFLLLAYIAIAHIALKRARKPVTTALAGALALAVLSLLIATALSKHFPPGV